MLIPWLSFWRLRLFKWRYVKCFHWSYCHAVINWWCSVFQNAKHWLSFTFVLCSLSKKQLCKGGTYKKFEKQAFRFEIYTFEHFEVGSVHTMTPSLAWKCLNFDGGLKHDDMNSNLWYVKYSDWVSCRCMHAYHSDACLSLRVVMHTHHMPERKVV